MRLSSPAARALSAVLLAAALMSARPPERASATPDALTGNLPTSGGFGLAVWGGGSLSALTGSAAGGGCTALAVWVAFFIGSWRGRHQMLKVAREMMEYERGAK